MEFEALIRAAEQLKWAEEKQRLEELQQLEKEKNFFVAFVGCFSAGKSHLINNLLGRELLPCGTTETTAALTYICYGEEEKALVHCTDGTVRQITLEQVRDIDQRKEIWDPETLEYLEVFLKSELLQGGMILLDTPGFNTVIQRHEQMLARSLALAARVVYVMGGAPGRVDLEKLTQMKASGLNIACVRTRLDELDPEEESLESACAFTCKALSRCGIDDESCYFVSNMLESEYYARLEPLKAMLAEYGAHAQEQLAEAVAAQTKLLAEHLYAGLEERRKVLEAAGSADKTDARKKQDELSRQIRLLNQTAEDRQEQMNRRVQEAQRKLDGTVTRQMQEDLEESAERIRASDGDEKETKELIQKEAQRQVVRLAQHISEVSDQALQQTNTELKKALESAALDKLPGMTAENFAAACQQEDDEMAELKRQLWELKEKPKKLEARIAAMKDTPEYEQAQRLVLTAQNNLEAAQMACEQHGPYVPQYVYEEQKGLKPSEIAGGLGQIAEIMLVTMTGAQLGAIAGNVGMKLLTSNDALMKPLGSLLQSMAKSGLIEKADTINDSVIKARWLDKTLNAISPSRAKAKEQAAYTQMARKVTGQVVAGGVSAVGEFKKAQNYHPEDMNNSEPNFLDMISLSYWTTKLGEKLDTPPRKVESVQHAKEWQETHEQLEKDQAQKQQFLAAAKRQADSFSEQEEELKAEKQAAEADAAAVEQELVRCSREAEAKNKADAMKKWREECSRWYCDQLQPELEQQIAAARAQLPERLNYYQAKRLQAVQGRLQEKQAELDQLMHAPESSNAQELQKTAALQQQIREECLNG